MELLWLIPLIAVAVVLLRPLLIEPVTATLLAGGMAGGGSLLGGVLGKPSTPSLGFKDWQLALTAGLQIPQLLMSLGMTKEALDMAAEWKVASDPERFQKAGWGGPPTGVGTGLRGETSRFFEDFPHVKPYAGLLASRPESYAGLLEKE